MNKNILIIGSSGQLGSCFIKNKNNFKKLNIYFKDKKELDILDIDNLSSIINFYNIKIIINCVAQTNVAKCETDRKTADLINNISLINLSSICKEKNVLLIHFSTDYVFDGTKNIPYSESDITNPLNYYGLSKLNGEKQIIASGCEYIILRICLTYSEFKKNFIKFIINSKNKKELILANDVISTPTSCDSVVRFIYENINNNKIFEKQIKNNIFHFTQLGSPSIYDIGKKIKKLANININIIKGSIKDISSIKRPLNSTLSINKVQEMFNITPNNWEIELEKFIKYYKL